MTGDPATILISCVHTADRVVGCPTGAVTVPVVDGQIVDLTLLEGWLWRVGRGWFCPWCQHELPA